MKIIVPLVTVLAVSTGSLAGAAAYQRAVGPEADPVGVPVARQEPAATVVPGARFRWAPCQAPAVLREGVCVTEVTRTVTLPAPAPVAAAPAVAPVTTGYGYGDDGDDGADDGEGYDDDGDDDHEDHDGDDDHGDDDDHDDD
ncbi:MAG: hypothetical protein ACXWDL_03095 [Nocardioides sp.]